MLFLRVLKKTNAFSQAFTQAKCDHVMTANPIPIRRMGPRNEPLRLATGEHDANSD